MGSVQINSDGAGGQQLSQAYAISTANLSFYCRVLYPTLLSTWAVSVSIQDGSGNGPSLFCNAGGQSIQWDNGGTATGTMVPVVSPLIWYDFACVKTGGTTRVWSKRSTDALWTGPTVCTTATITPSTINLGGYVAAQVLSNRPTRYGKLVVWSTTQPFGVVQAEANGRALQDLYSGQVWFYNPCDSAATIQTDMSGAGHNFTVTGTPADDTSDPGFIGGYPQSLFFGAAP